MKNLLIALALIAVFAVVQSMPTGKCVNIHLILYLKSTPVCHKKHNKPFKHRILVYFVSSERFATAIVYLSNLPYFVFTTMFLSTCIIKKCFLCVKGSSVPLLINVHTGEFMSEHLFFYPKYPLVRYPRS